MSLYGMLIEGQVGALQNVTLVDTVESTTSSAMSSTVCCNVLSCEISASSSVQTASYTHGIGTAFVQCECSHVGVGSLYY